MKDKLGNWEIEIKEDKLIITGLGKYRLCKLNEGFIEFTNGLKIFDEHEQDCCEHVYVDWNSPDDLFRDMEFSDTLTIEKLSGQGILINKFFIAAYNNQNGYYSSYLALSLKYEDDIVEWDISGTTLDIGEQLE